MRKHAIEEITELEIKVYEKMKEIKQKDKNNNSNSKNKFKFAFDFFEDIKKRA